MYCSFDFVRAIRRCHSCMDFLWIAFFDSISYLLQSRKVHLLKNQWNILLRRKNFAIFQIYPFSLWDNADVRVWEDQGGKYQVGWWKIFLEYVFTFRPINPNDLRQSVPTQQSNSICTWWRGAVVCAISIELKWQKNRSILIDVPCMIRVHDSFKISKRKFSNLAEMDKSCNNWIFKMPTFNIHCAYEVSSSYCWNILSLLHLR